MSKFETVLQACLRDVEQGTASVEECLRRHPAYAAELGPILRASSYLERTAEVPISDELKARLRGRVMQEVRAHPRKPVARTGSFVRFSIALAAVTLAFLVTGTVYAQGALPGSAFYGWKLASERAWRTVSTDPLGTDLKIAARRADELIAVSKDPVLYPQALRTYLKTADRLKSEVNVGNEARILPLLESQTEKLIQSGVSLPQPEEQAPPTSGPTVVPAATGLPLLQTPQPAATQPPPSVPTLEVPRDGLPTVKAPPKIAPTIEVPPPAQ